MVLADSVGWEDMLHSLPGILTVTFIFGGWIIVAVVARVAKNWRMIHESEHAAALKQSMIERGMSADEIERVLRATPAGPFDESGSGEAKDISKKLAEHSVPAPAVEQILGAFRTASPGMRKTLAGTVVAMLDGGAKSDQVLAAVRAISRPGPEPAHDPHLRDTPASYRG
jgi:hypothetical protein